MRRSQFLCFLNQRFFYIPVFECVHSCNIITFIQSDDDFISFVYFRTLKGWKPRRLGGGFGGKKESGQLRFGGRARPFQRPYEIGDTTKPTNFREIFRQQKQQR